ncbi:MAG: hypothetical protein JJT94_01530 [Bernardetiaceae bacterium]|nr:hypothetical protein [Bernardetiaceae bacterium]
MAQFIPFAPNVEVNGQTVLSIVNAFEVGRLYRLSILEEHGIENPQPGEWYSQAAWLNAFKEIADSIGDHTLFSIGKSIPENADFPPDIDNLKKALQAINMAYQMNHRGGDIGYYKLIKFDEQAKIAYMECRNPYPSEFDRGIITTMARRFKPADAMIANVELDTLLPTRLQGAESCTYKVTWS